MKEIENGISYRDKRQVYILKPLTKDDVIEPADKTIEEIFDELREEKKNV
jgi:hypothetical protein